MFSDTDCDTSPLYSHEIAIGLILYFSHIFSSSGFNNGESIFCYRVLQLGGVVLPAVSGGREEDEVGGKEQGAGLRYSVGVIDFIEIKVINASDSSSLKLGADP